MRPHLAFPTVEIRICDGQPELAEAQSLAGLLYALTARIARAHDEGEPLPAHPHHLIEENLWRATRHGLSESFIDLDRRVVLPARQRIEDLLTWIAPVAEELGASAYLGVPERNAAERQIALCEAGEGLEDIYAAEVLEPVRV